MLEHVIGNIGARYFTAVCQLLVDCRLVVPGSWPVRVLGWTQDGPVEVARLHLSLHANEISIHIFEESPQDYLSCQALPPNQWIKAAGRDAENAAHFGRLHCLHDVCDAL